MLLSKIEELTKINFQQTNKQCLFSGDTGVAIWYLYLSRCFNDSSFYEKGINTITEVIDTLYHTSQTHTFCNGYAGIGWSILHLMDQNFIDLDPEILDVLDEHLYYCMQNDLQKNNWDYLHGASGIILYFLKKNQNNRLIDVYINEYVNKMYNLAINEDKHLKWKIIIDHEKKVTGINISLSHGMSSLVGIFLKIYQQYKTNDLEHMIRGAVQYIIKQKIDCYHYGSCFPSYSIETDDSLQGSRLGWCYGDLGISMVLWQAGTLMNVQEWCDIAVNTMLHASHRKNDNSVKDAGLCHGAAGIAHIFNRMYKYTKMNEFKNVSMYWANKTIEMAHFEDGVAGFKTFVNIDDPKWVVDYGFLTGVTGIGLSLLSLVSDIEPAWDECLLLS